MEFRLLGPVGVWNAGRPVAVPGRRERTMLAILLLEAGRLVPIDRMVHAVWGDAPPATARRQVHNGMSVLRRVLGELLVTREPGYLLRAEPDAIDLHTFDSRVAQARHAATTGRLDDAATGLRAALRLWHGPALGGVTGLAGEAARLEERRLTVLAERVGADLALGQHADLVGELSGLVAEHPLHEQFRSQLMLSLYRCGRQAEALQAYRDARRVLTEGLGLEPGSELRRLEQAILVGDPGLDLASAVVSAAPGSASRSAPCLLPADIADFTGRDDQIDLLRDALCAGDGGALVLSAVAGWGGVGKTALAVHVAHRLRHAFADGQLYVDLHGVQAQPVEPAEVLGRFLRALGVDGTAIPPGPDERAEMYRGRLAGRRVLVVLDNARDEAQVSPLLPGSAGCAVLVTSRARLGGLAGARTVELDVLDTDQAVALLARIVGAERVLAEPAAAARLVALCGRLPLAVRIAGARLAARPHWLIAELAGRLTDEHHRLDELSHGGLAVRASLELSSRALDDEARCLFRRLGLLDAPDFAGWVGAALLDTSLARAQELAELLVDARLLEVVGRDALGATRYRFHDLVRVYAWERAGSEDSPAERQAAVQRALGAWLAGAERAHRAVYGGDYVIVHGAAPRWHPGAVGVEDDPLTWLETERLALVAAVAQAAEHGWDELAWDLAQSSVALFAIRWYLEDWRQTHERALAATRLAGNRRGEAATLYCTGAWHDARGQYEQAMGCFETARDMFDAVGDDHGVGLALAYASHIARRLGRFDDALATGERGRALLREVGDRAGEASALRSLAQTRLGLGEFERAERGLAEALAILSDTGNRRDQAQVHYWVGELHLGRGSLEQAGEAFDRVLEVVRGMWDRVGEAYALHGLGACHLRQARYALAEVELGQALCLARDTGMRFLEARVQCDLAELNQAQARGDEATERLRQALGLWRQLKAPLWQARALRTLGDIEQAAGHDGAAIVAWTEARALFVGLGCPEADQVAALLSAGREENRVPGG